MNAPLFSVIIPTYGRQRFLSEAIQSVLDQSVPDLECIVVDDASPQTVCVSSDPRVRLIRRSDNGGPAAARNSGINVARGRYIAFLDDDDLYAPDRLALALEGLERAPIAVCWSRFLDEPSGSRRILEGDVSSSILDGMTPHLGATAVERSIIRLFDESFVATQDIEWWLRMARRATVATVPGYGDLIRKHSTPRHRNGKDERVRASFMLMHLHHEYFASHPKAAAFRFKRVGLMANGLGDLSTARRAFIRSLRIRPDAKTLWHLLRSTRRSTHRLDLETTLSDFSFQRGSRRPDC